MNRFLITMQYDENRILPIFLKHYSRYFSPENIFVIDHGSSSNLIPAGYNRIYVPRDKPFSEAARLDLIQKISQGLLNYYDIGVYSDSDELISFEGVNFDAFTNDATYVAGFEVFLGSSGNVLGALNPLECKSLIFSKTPNWSFGFHSSSIPPNKLSIPMAHIRYFDKEFSSDRLNGRKVIRENIDLAEGNLGIASHWAGGDKEFREFYSYIDSNQDKISQAISFGPVDWKEVFVKSEPIGLYIQQQARYVAKGDYKIFNGTFYDLTSYFPALL